MSVRHPRIPMVVANPTVCVLIDVSVERRIRWCEDDKREQEHPPRGGPTDRSAASSLHCLDPGTPYGLYCSQISVTSPSSTVNHVWTRCSTKVGVIFAAYTSELTFSKR